MKVAVFRRWPLVFALAGLILSLRAQSAWSKAPPHRPGELIVKFRKLPSNLPGKFSPQSAGGLPSSLDRLLSAAGANDMTLLFPRSIASAWRAQSVSGGAPVSAGLDGIALVKFPESADIENLAALFAADPDVEYAEPNYLYHLSAAPNDTNFSLQWGLRNTGQSGNIVSGDPATGTAGADIKAAGAWDTTTGYAGVIVAVVDSGVDWDHLDLAANIWSNDDPVDGVDNDGNGKIDDVRGWDFGDKDNNPTDDSGLDSNGNPDESTAGHGTNAAGVIAAVGNNSLGVAGVMWKASIMPVKIADSTGNIYGAQFAQGIQYAAANGAKIINLSIGGSHTQSLADAIDYATGQGALIVAAAGNESTEDNSASYPAAYTSVVAVAATDRTDKKTSASNYGSWVDIAAPGLAVQTTDINNAYAWASGTSFASPMVAGIAGLIASYYTGISTAAIRSRLLSSADNIDALNPSFAGKLGSGRANAATALAPDVPAGISGSALGVSTITWSWGASSGALSYNVYSATSSTLLGNGVSTAAVVSALSTNTAYGIRVTGVNNSAESSLSQATTVYTLAAPPTSFALVEVHISSISVAWAANTNPAGTTTYRSEIWKAGGSTTTQTLSLTSATFTGLTPGTTYFLTVGALNGNGILTASNLEISTSTLGLVAPVSLSAAALGVSSITWSWPNVNNEEGFRVLTSTGGNLSGNLPPNTVSWTETGLSTNTATSRRVAAFSDAEVSTSPSATAYTLAAPATGFALTAVHIASITVSWAANTNPAGTTTYRAEIWQAGGSTTTQTVSVTSAAFTGLSSGTTYFMALRAVNSDGALTDSGVISTTTLALAAPVSLSTAVLGVSSITWSWPDVNDEEGFRVLSSTGGNLSGDLPPDTLSWTETGLSTNTATSRRIAAFAASAISLSPSATAYTLAAPATGFALAGVHIASITVSWAANTNPAGTTTYRAEIWQIGGSTTTQTVSETSATFTGLSSRTTYFLSVRALNGEGVLTTASPVISTATPGLSAPASLSAAALGVSSVTWSWPDVTDKDGFRVVSSTGGNISGDLSPNTLAWTETGLSTNTATSRRVVVFFTSLVSTSPFAAAYTLAATPTSFALAGVHFTSMTVVWAANTNPAGTTTYRAEIWQIGGATTTQTLSITSATFTGLSAATTYYLSVRPANGDGVLSAPAGPLTAATFSNAPAAFAAAAQGVSSITWTWNGVSGAIRYNFYPSTGGTAIAVAANSLTLVKLSTNTAYSGRVSATNSSGEGLLSSAATAYTLAAPPTGFALVEVHFTSVTVSWAANTNPAGTTTYRAEIWKSGSAATAQTVSWTSATFSNLTGGGTYFMTVGALSGGGELSASGITLSTVTQRQLSTQTVVNSGGAGSVNFVPPTGRIELNLPPGSFQETVTLTLEIPSDFPSAPSAAGRLQGTRVGIEITADKPLQPAQIATLSISYRDADVAGLDENKLILARYDAGASLWVPLVSVPDTAQNKVTGRTDHFSLFQVMQSSPALTVLNPKIFPNPLRPALGHGEMKFADLPAGASIRIYTVAGELVQELQSNAAGIASWNGRNRSGEKAASGVYFVFIEKDGERKTFKAAVQR